MVATHIYGLCDPETNELRYIGKTIQSISRRTNEHIYERGHSYCKSWIKSLKNKGLRPKAMEIENHPIHEDGLEAEIFWIAYFKSLGCNLTNLAKGGRGSYGYKMPLEAIAKISKALQGNQHTKGYKHTKEALMKISMASKAKHSDPIFKEKHKIACQGEKNGNSKVTIEDVKNIRYRYANKERRSDILKDYSITRNQLHNIVNHISWRNI